MTTQTTDPTPHRPASTPVLIPFSTYAHHHPHRPRRLGRRARQRRALLRQARVAAMVAGS